MSLKCYPTCMVALIPKPIRLLLAWLLLAIGAILMIMPIPGGTIVLSIGLLLLYCTSMTMRKHIDKKLSERPRIYGFLKPILRKCDACSVDKTLDVFHPSCHSVKGRGTK
jgi:hypothetical protein